MLKKTIKYDNPFTNEEVTEEHYFHISKADLVEMEMEEHGYQYEKDGQKLTGMQARLQKIIDAQDGKAIMFELKDIIRRSYGKKEGDRFVKSKEVWNEFESSEAFSQLLFDLCTDAGAASEFMNGIVPRKLAEQVAAEVKTRTSEEAPSTVPAIAAYDEAAEKTGAPTTSDITDPTGLTGETTPRVLTPTDMAAMDAEDLKAGLASGKYKLS